MVGWQPIKAPKKNNVSREPVTLERLERGLLIAARMLVRHGPVVMPIFERLEREIAAMRSSQDAVGRAKKLLEAYNMADGVKAIA